MQYLQHSTSDALHTDEKVQREKAPPVTRRIVGVVVSAGRMHKTVKVRVPGQEWNRKIGKV
jgi:small subunit ribosomal protein S17